MSEIVGILYRRFGKPPNAILEDSNICKEAKSTPAGESPLSGSLATPKDSASRSLYPKSPGNVNAYFSICKIYANVLYLDKIQYPNDSDEIGMGISQRYQAAVE